MVNVYCVCVFSVFREFREFKEFRDSQKQILGVIAKLTKFSTHNIERQSKRLPSNFFFAYWAIIAIFVDSYIPFRNSRYGVASYSE